ncbi:MAG: helix-turn-helix domain-containing protein [Planctomycetota bacterium]|jgi:excisionase family DNA binding protein
MSAITVPGKKVVGHDINRAQSDYMTTTDVARLCGVSRFTIINWAKEGKIKTIRTVGRHHRIQASEALYLLKSLGEKRKVSAPGPEGSGRQKQPAANSNDECGNCLTSNKEDKCTRAKNKNVLRSICYTLGRGAHILKERRIAK